MKAALKNVKDFKEGPVAQAIIEAAHKNIGSEDTLAVDKANVCVKHKLCMTSSAFCCNVETEKKTLGLLYLIYIFLGKNGW